MIDTQILMLHVQVACPSDKALASGNAVQAPAVRLARVALSHATAAAQYLTALLETGGAQAGAHWRSFPDDAEAPCLWLWAALTQRIAPARRLLEAACLKEQSVPRDPGVP